MTVVDGYCRISGDKQEDGTSLDEQERAFGAYCAENNLTLGMIHREIQTGRVYRERKKLSLMRERYRSGKIQGVVFRNYDRLARTSVHQAILLEEMEDAGISVYCTHEQLDDTFEGKMTRMLLGLLAEYEWEKIRERTTTGRINRAKEGKIVGGRKLPYGWQWQYSDNGEKAAVIHHPEQVVQVRWMCGQYDAGVSTISIAKQLTEACIPSGDGKTDWHPIMVHRILSDERLIGKGKNFAYQQKAAKQRFEPIDLPDDTYPRIIDDDLFYRIQDRLARAKNEAPRNNEQPEEFLLRAGYVKCGYCNRSMQSHIDRRSKNDRYVYRCNRRNRKGNIECQIGQDVLSKIVDKWVDEQLLILAEHTELIAHAIQLASNEDNLKSDARSIDASLETWKKRAKNYMNDLADPDLCGESRASIRQSLNDANKRVQELQAEKSQVMLGLIGREREHAAYAEILAWCERVRVGGKDLSYQHKRDFLHLLGVMVTVKNKGNGIPECKIEVTLPEIQAVLTSAISTVEQCPETMCHDQPTVRGTHQSTHVAGRCAYQRMRY